MTKRHDKAVKDWKFIAKTIGTLADANCKGVNTELLEFAARTIRKALNDILGRDGIHINEVSEHFGVSNVTIRTWIKNDGLQPPLKKEDEERTYITFETFNKLIDIHKHN